MEYFSPGKRLQAARHIKRMRLKDLADAFNVGYLAIQKWQDRGIPDSAIEAVADYFKVKKWVFCDETLSEKDFKEIIKHPILMDKFQAIFIFKGGPKSANQAQKLKSDLFFIPTKSVLLRGKVWGVKGVSYTYFLIVEKDKQNYGMKGSAHLPPNPQFTIITDENTEESHYVTQEKIINNVKKGEYHISVNSKHFFELSIFPN